ncbi:hypothetical protein AA0117_g3697 [Alternaria alternata]|uniref:Uncharacterized protein n=1 Tax=Alternaria alternata TaxID=5599 RepID=A0A4Q4NLL3_ALTAL|nr:hypothetical protein IG631_20326 [Alternaria alternata]RYN79432.1 hypothetical protein AA0117_g3697 [Alternaria alternata]
MTYMDHIGPLKTWRYATHEDTSVKYDILDLYNGSRIKCGHQRDNAPATDIGPKWTQQCRAN